MQLGKRSVLPYQIYRIKFHELIKLFFFFFKKTNKCDKGSTVHEGSYKIFNPIKMSIMAVEVDNLFIRVQTLRLGAWAAKQVCLYIEIYYNMMCHNRRAGWQDCIRFCVLSQYRCSLAVHWFILFVCLFIYLLILVWFSGFYIKIGSLSTHTGGGDSDCTFSFLFLSAF